MTNSSLLDPARDIYHRLQWLADYQPALLLPVSELPMMRRLIRRVQPRQTEHALIRVGPANDGGYLIPDDLDGIRSCFSPGVNNQIEFDLALARRGIRVHMADASVSAPDGMASNMTFEPMFLGAEDHGSVMTMESWVQKVQEEGDHDLMLQMDIEGCEYEVIASMSSALMSRFRIMAIEFHLLDNLWNPGFFRLVAPLFRKLATHHQCVHIHPNNCQGVVDRGGIQIPRIMEMTFLRKDRIQQDLGPSTQFPHPLDADSSELPTLVLPPCWWMAQEEQE
jgi:hypothetical protein